LEPLRHDAVVAPLAAGLDGRAAYLVMDHVVGESLGLERRGGTTALAEVASVVASVAAAIDACADRGVRHLRLHPRDVILTSDGAHVTGFGIAEALSSIGMNAPPRPTYAPPDGPSDVYALAGIAYEMISGRRMTRDGWDELSAEDGPELREAFSAALSLDP